MSQNGLPDGTKTGKGSLADGEMKATWVEAYRLYQLAPVGIRDLKAERTERIGYVAQRLGITRKAAKRRVKNYEGWQTRIDPSFRKFVPDAGRSGGRNSPGGGRHAQSGWRERGSSGLRRSGPDSRYSRTHDRSPRYPR